MLYKSSYLSPVGELLIVTNEDSIIGLWIENQKYFPKEFKEEVIENDNITIMVETKKWLDSYFLGKNPDISRLKLMPEGSDFRQIVWKLLCKIPYGETITYGEIAEKVSKIMNIKSMSSQAVGGAVGHNPISIIVPCHRVVGKDGSLTGYAGGIDRKIKLLKLEGVDIEKFRDGINDD